MADSLEKIAPQDGRFVNVKQAHEVKGWCAVFRCTAPELRSAVYWVGTSKRRVAEFFDFVRGKRTRVKRIKRAAR